jgi:AcrR family transcriptional regulator
MSDTGKNALLSFVTGEQGAPPDPLGTKILDAAFEQFCLVGIRRSSMDDVARRAGVGRVTIYRRFESKDKLVAALLAREVRDAIAKVAAEHEGSRDVEGRWVAGFATGMRIVRKHRLLTALLSTEPEEVLPLLTRRAGAGLALTRTFMAQEIKRSRKELGLRSVDADATAEILARLTLSLVLTPETCFAIDDDEGARRFARKHILPMVTGAPARAR